MLKAIFGGVCAFCFYLFGNIDIPFQTLLFFLVGDFLVGTYGAITRKEMESRKCWEGFVKKILTLFVVAIAWRIDIMVNAGGYVRMIAVYGFIGSELYSVIENLGKLGLVIPTKLLSYFKGFGEKLEADTTPEGENKNG